MGGDGGRHVRLVGLEVRDEAGYARYREGMAPILARYGGAFGCDFVVARVLVGPDRRINRVFTLVFPNRERRERFFSDDEYLAVRAQWFETSVGAVEVLEDVSAMPGE